MLECHVKFVLQWLKDGFLKYLQDWEDSVNKRKGFTAAQRAQMLLSSQTREGLRMTGKYFLLNILS